MNHWTLSYNAPVQGNFSRYSPDATIAYFPLSTDPSVESIWRKELEDGGGLSALCLVGMNLNPYGSLMSQSCQLGRNPSVFSRVHRVDEAGLYKEVGKGPVRHIFDAEKDLLGFV